MPIRFQQAVKEVALWDDVVAAFNGRPYRMMSKTGISSIRIADAHNRGYFEEGHSYRIFKATNGRLKLTPYAEVQSRLKQQAVEGQNAKSHAAAS